MDYLPNPNDPLFVASVGFTPMTYVTVAHRRRAAAILTRRSDRLPFRAPQNWPAAQLLLSRAVEGRPDEDSAAIFDVLSHDDRTTLAEASRLSEALRQYDSDYHAELDWWTGPFGDSDGIPHGSLVSAAEGQRVDVGRSFPSPITAGTAGQRLHRTVRRSLCCRPTATLVKTWCAAARLCPGFCWKQR